MARRLGSHPTTLLTWSYMNRTDYNRIRNSVYGAILITPDNFGDWIITDVKFDRILSAAHGSRLAVIETLQQMHRDNELGDILPMLIDSVKSLWFCKRSYSGKAK